MSTIATFLTGADVVAASQVSPAWWRAMGYMASLGPIVCVRDGVEYTFEATDWDDREFASDYHTMPPKLFKPSAKSPTSGIFRALAPQQGAIRAHSPAI